MTPTQRAVRAIPTVEHVQRATRATDAAHYGRVLAASEQDEAPVRRWVPRNPRGES